MTAMPALETRRLIVRPFELSDLDAVYQLFDVDLFPNNSGKNKIETMQERLEWLQWSVLNYQQLAKLRQPPYGDRAMVIKQSGELVGSCGYVPCLGPYAQLPGFDDCHSSGSQALNTTEFGLYYAVSPIQQRKGFASEAAQAMVDYAFRSLNLKRVIATTDYDNIASMGVMKKLGMQIEKNPIAQPPWLQVVGVLERKTTSTEV
jgi:ribosomal-protein-alanine N-acetyltransferase